MERSDRVVDAIEAASTDEEKLAIEASAIRPTDNSARDGDNDDQSK